MSNIWINSNQYHKYQSIPSTDNHDRQILLNQKYIEVKMHPTQNILDDSLFKKHINEKRRYLLSTSIFLVIFFLVFGLLYWFNQIMPSNLTDLMKFSSYANVTSPIMSPTSRPNAMAPWSIYIPEPYRPVLNNNNYNMENDPSIVSDPVSNIPPYAIWIPIAYNPYYIPSYAPSNIPIRSPAAKVEETTYIVNIPIEVNVKVPIPSKTKVKDITNSLGNNLLDKDVNLT